MRVGQSLIIELEEAIQSGSKDKRVDALRRITDLFVADAGRLNDQQVDVSNDILEHLIKRIESGALAELSRRLAPIHNAPVEVVRRLARDDDIVIAEPILAAWARLSDSDLIEIASTRPQAHLLAISARPQIGTAVTDFLLQRGMPRTRAPASRRAALRSSCGAPKATDRWPKKSGFASTFRCVFSVNCCRAPPRLYALACSNWPVWKASGTFKASCRRSRKTRSMRRVGEPSTIMPRRRQVSRR